jgi:hypothetical protein
VALTVDLGRLVRRGGTTPNHAEEQLLIELDAK